MARINVNLASAKGQEKHPEGPLLVRITQYELGESPNKKTPYIRYMMEPESGENKRGVRRDFFLTPESNWVLAQFYAAAMGIDADKEAIVGDGFDAEDLIGRVLWVEIKHNEKGYMDVDRPFRPVKNG